MYTSLSKSGREILDFDISSMFAGNLNLVPFCLASWTYAFSFSSLSTKTHRSTDEVLRFALAYFSQSILAVSLLPKFLAPYLQQPPER